MKIEIKSRFTAEVLFSFECENNTTKLTLRAAVKAGANLCGANLYDANLYDADLCGANLRGADLCDTNLRGANLYDADLCGANLRGADLCDTNLRGANLYDADLCGTNLRGANLCGANLRGEKLEKAPLFLHNLLWHVTITTESIKIGCQHHKIEAWRNFDDERISEMHSAAVEFWAKNKAAIMALADAHAAD